MARRFQEITEVYRQEIAALARSDRWTAFLRSACRNYKLPFEEQVLVHAQRPDATAVLEIERWNRQFGRWVNKGATGIAVFDRDYPGRTRLKYYFDISDTHESRLSRPVPLWQVPAEQEPDVIEALENRFGALDDKGTLEEAIVSAMENAAADNMTDYLDDLQNCRDNSLLEELDELNLSVLYRRLLENSTAYMLMCRCGLEPDEYFDPEDFSEVFNFNTPETLNALEYNLSVIQRPQAGKSKHYGEWRAEQEQRPTWRGLIRSEIDELIRQSVTEKQFYYLLRQKGYEVKFGKDISVRPPGKERFVRLTRNFGEAYTAEAIRQRILQQPLPQPERQMTDKPRPKTYRVQGSRQAARKITGFRALYFYYCYKLGIFPKGRPQNRARLHFLLREDLLKLNNISQEVRLLARHQIDTAEQLALYKKEQEVNIRELSAKRRVLQNALRTKAVRDSPKQADAHRAQIRELSERLKALRREVHLCDDIAERSGVMVEKLKAVREDAQKQRQKEEQQHEHIWRRS